MLQNVDRTRKDHLKTRTNRVSMGKGNYQAVYP